MILTTADDSQWEIARNVEEVHNLLCACDAYHATSNLSAPARNIASTVRRVTDGSVQLLRQNGTAVAMFTLTWVAPFDQGNANWPKAHRPAYISRLAVQPSHLCKGTILGLRCYRRAFELATSSGADAIRLEANPDLKRIGSVLQMLGFVCYGQRVGADGLKRVYLQKTFGKDNSQN